MFRYIEINGFIFINFIAAVYITIWNSRETISIAA